ncbi:MAG: polysaccharide biosynthesis tyrosine autokinase [Bacteroidales bacterium]|nr:polysaccharide biosynthesis tyrosine autokinase [Bacteroidales bacterium]
MQENNYTSHNYHDEEASLDLKKILNVVWGMRWIILASVLLCLLLAWCYNKVTKTRYTANAKIMLVNMKGRSDLINLSDLISGFENSYIANETEILNSRTLMQRVVEEFGLNYTYEKKRPIKSINYYGNNPFRVLVDSTENFSEPPQMQLFFSPTDSSSFQISKLYMGKNKYPIENKSYKFGEEFAVSDHNFIIEKTHLGKFEPGDTYIITMEPSRNTANRMRKNLSVNAQLKTSSARSDVINLSYNDVVPRRAEDILDCLIDKYNIDAKEFSSKAVENTIDFLTDRLGVIEDELSTIEGQFQNYRRSNTVVDVASQSQLSLSSDAKYEEQLNAIDVQIELLSIIKDYVGQMDAALMLIPANIGISDTGLNSTINQFNTLLMERNRMVASSSESNPLVIQSDKQLQELLSNIVTSVRNQEKSLSLQRNNINAKLRQSKSRLSAMPSQQLELTRFGRQQQVKEPLYILLQQKKEEALISLYAIADRCKVVDPAHFTAYATAPNRKMIYLLAFLLGFILPPAIFFLRQMLKSKVEGKLDITNRTDIPVLASIPISDHPGQLMEVTGRDPFEETIRILRSNVRYLGHRVFQITSSVPGEGKSYISSNLALSIAHTGFKVLLVGIDLRKPQLAKIFNIRQEHNQGLVPYLVGKTSDLAGSIARGVNGVATLDVLPAGAIPPNPSELIESDKMERTVNELKAMNYDYILFDSSPYLPVADATTFNRYVDANIFMLRAGVCELRFVEDLDETVRDKKLKNVYIVLNGVDIKARSYGYHYGYGYGHYGYGKNKYGYGYGYGYGDKKKVGQAETAEPETK